MLFLALTTAAPSMKLGADAAADWAESGINFWPLFSNRLTISLLVHLSASHTHNIVDCTLRFV